MEQSRDDSRAPDARARRDLGVVVGLTVLWAALAARMELSEQVAALTAHGERFQLDEVPYVLLMLAGALAWFAWRRYREARMALACRHQAEQRLAATLADNRRLIGQSIVAQENERRSLARDLHDELGQYVNAIRVEAVTLRRRLAPAAADLEGVAQSIDASAHQLQELVRDMVRRLRPVALDELGLQAAIEHCVDEWRRRLPGTAIELRCRHSDLDDLGEVHNLTLYRLVQEGITNVARHAQASRLCVEISRASDHSQRGREIVLLTIEDNGSGSDPGRANAAGLGLIGMRERVEALHGSLRIDAHNKPGFRIEARIPVHADHLDATGPAHSGDS